MNSSHILRYDNIEKINRRANIMQDDKNKEANIMEDEKLHEEVNEVLSFLNSKIIESKKNNLPYYMWEAFKIVNGVEHIANLDKVVIDIILKKLSDSGYRYDVKENYYPDITKIKIYWDREKYYADFPDKKLIESALKKEKERRHKALYRRNKAIKNIDDFKYN